MLFNRTRKDLKWKLGCAKDRMEAFTGLLEVDLGHISTNLETLQTGHKPSGEELVVVT